jgi:hypothetical protein
VGPAVRQLSALISATGPGLERLRFGGKYLDQSFIQHPGRGTFAFEGTVKRLHFRYLPLEQAELPGSPDDD